MKNLALRVSKEKLLPYSPIKETNSPLSISVISKQKVESPLIIEKEKNVGPLEMRLSWIIPEDIYNR